jgi:integrase
MKREEVEKLINAFKDSKDRYKKGLLALATTYGLRRIELYRLTKDDIDENKIFVFTAKGGEPREHIIPAQILDIVADFKGKLKKLRYIQELNIIFDEMFYEAGIELRPMLGIHSIRRALITELMQTPLNPNIIRNFLRWKGRGVDILQEYTLFNPEEVDRKVFEHHPFLNLWL